MCAQTRLLLVPGLLCDAALWRHQLEGLSDAAEVWVTDKHTGYASIGEIAHAIMQEAPAKFSVAGLSMGGYIALEMALNWSARIERLILLDTTAAADTPSQTERRETLIELARRGKIEEIIQSLLPAFVHPERLRDLELVSEIVEMAKRVGTDKFIRQQEAIISRRNQTSNLHRIACPALVICGREDALTPLECSEKLTAGIPDSELLVVPDCGHLSTMESPRRVTEAMRRWLFV